MHSAAMSAGAMNNGDSRLNNGWLRARRDQTSAKFFRLAHLRRMRGTEQVAAVCYRIRNGDVEFLLVQTRGGRWTFPKGGAEPGLTHAQAAALEAFEEAGVHGRMEEASFTRYFRGKGGNMRDSAARSGQRSSGKELAVNAYLCEVLRLDPPQESDRNRTWFTVEKTKRRLRDDRTPDYGAELVRVVDRALTRIRRLRGAATSTVDGMQKVRFGEIRNPQGAMGTAQTSAIGGKNRRNIIQIDQF
jgi:8-oxo-dGTP pyrophosphatase MutT (NUDIX family)